MLVHGCPMGFHGHYVDITTPGTTRAKDKLYIEGLVQ